jgi:hypothetical protein
MQTNSTNARAFEEQGMVGSNIIRRVEVWGFDPNYSSTNNGPGIPVTLCRDSTGFIYQVLGQSGMGTVAPQVGDTWLINRTLGLWTFMARISILSPITQYLTEASSFPYTMVPSNRFIFAAPPNGTTWAVTLPNPITAVQGEVYGFRNVSGGGTGYNGLLTLSPFSSEAIHGPNAFGAHSGATFVSDNKEWFCIGDTVASQSTQIGGA